MKRATGGGGSGGRPGPYDIRDRGANRGGNDFGGRNGEWNELREIHQDSPLKTFLLQIGATTATLVWGPIICWASITYPA